MGRLSDSALSTALPAHCPLTAVLDKAPRCADASDISAALDADAIDLDEALKHATALGIDMDVNVVLLAYGDKGTPLAGSGGEIRVRLHEFERVAEWHSKGYSIGIFAQRLADPTGKFCKENVAAIRVLTIDDLAQVPKAWPGGVEPTVMVQTSASSYQAQFVLAAEVNCDLGVMLMKRMAAAHPGSKADGRADPSIAKPTQVVRLAGTLNRKAEHGEHFRARIAGEVRQRVPVEAIEAAYSEVAAHNATHAPATKSSEQAIAAAATPEKERTAIIRMTNHEKKIAEAQDFLAAIPHDGTRDQWLLIANALKGAFGEEGRSLFYVASSNWPNYKDEDDCRLLWDNLKVLHHGKLGALANIAKLFDPDIASRLNAKYKVSRPNASEPTRIFDNKGFQKTPNRQFDTVLWASLGTNAQAIYFAIRAVHNGRNNGNLTIGHDEIARAIGVSVDSVGRGTKELIACGLIKMCRQGGFGPGGRQRSQYQICDFGMVYDPDAEAYLTPPTIDWATEARIDAPPADGKASEKSGRSTARGSPKMARAKPKGKRKHPQQVAASNRGRGSNLQPAIGDGVATCGLQSKNGVADCPPYIDTPVEGGKYNNSVELPSTFTPAYRDKFPGVEFSDDDNPAF